MPNFFVDVRQDLVYACGWPSRLVRPIWKVKRAPKRAYPSFRRFLYAIAHHFLGDPASDVTNAKFFRGGPSRPCLCIKLAITACPNHLEGQTSPEASIRLISTIFVPCLCIRLATTACTTHLEAHHCLGDPDSDVKNPKFFRGRPSRPFLAYAHHFLGDPDSDVKIAKFFRGRPSRPFLCIRLAITACTTHLEGQTSPEPSIPLISMIFVCYSTPFFG
uniref:Uncharacterized protein n=1 Tax=Solanum lycopersicum TaxID=4081 RepID=A0A3Q7H5Z7_SOLLC